MPTGFKIDRKGFKTKGQEQYMYPLTEDPIYAESMRYQTSQQREGYRHREPPLRENEDDINNQFDEKRRKVVENLIA